MSQYLRDASRIVRADLLESVEQCTSSGMTTTPPGASRARISAWTVRTGACRCCCQAATLGSAIVSRARPAQIVEGTLIAVRKIAFDQRAGEQLERSRRGNTGDRCGGDSSSNHDSANRRQSPERRACSLSARCSSQPIRPRSRSWLIVAEQLNWNVAATPSARSRTGHAGAGSNRVATRSECPRRTGQELPPVGEL